MTILCCVGAVISMIYATSFGGSLLGFVDTFINQMALLLGVIIECIVFAWVFKAEKLVDFLNSRSRTIKLGRWWLVIVKYILPIIISVIWVGGMFDVARSGSFDQLNFTIVSAILLFGATLAFTLLPSKNEEWDNAEDMLDKGN